MGVGCSATLPWGISTGLSGSFWQPTRLLTQHFWPSLPSSDQLGPGKPGGHKPQVTAAFSSRPLGCPITSHPFLGVRTSKCPFLHPSPAPHHSP
jgi:hypothetical protein